ncbi:MAG: hypothetical protein ABSB76_35310 [Streptosporangiaceae bacterium]
MLASAIPALWIYLAGPALGAIAAGWMAAGRSRSRLLTGKLHHDPAISCYLRCALPHSADTAGAESAARAVPA